MSRNNGRTARLEARPQAPRGGTSNNNPPPPRRPSTSSSSPASSCVSEEEGGRRSGSPEATSMVLAGCPRCLMYVMLSEDDPKCPKCKSTVLVDLLSDPANDNVGGRKNKKR